MAQAGGEALLVRVNAEGTKVPKSALAPYFLPKEAGGREELTRLELRIGDESGWFFQ